MSQLKWFNCLGAFFFKFYLEKKKKFYLEPSLEVSTIT